MSTLDANLEGRAHELAEALRGEILRRQLRENELFGTEDDVASRHGVSRTVAREAVSRLRALGILRSRQGKGLLVGRANSVGLFSQTLPFAAHTDADLRRLLELRYVLEIGSVDLAVRHGSDEQIAELQVHADAYADAERCGNADAETAAELAFHSLILTMTGNPLVAGMHQVIAEYFRAEAERFPPPEGDSLPDTNWWDHASIARAFAQRDADLARTLLRKHLESILRKR